MIGGLTHVAKEEEFWELGLDFWSRANAGCVCFHTESQFRLAWYRFFRMNPRVSNLKHWVMMQFSTQNDIVDLYKTAYVNSRLVSVTCIKRQSPRVSAQVIDNQNRQTKAAGYTQSNLSGRKHTLRKQTNDRTGAWGAPPQTTYLQGLFSLCVCNNSDISSLFSYTCPSCPSVFLCCCENSKQATLWFKLVHFCVPCFGLMFL